MPADGTCKAAAIEPAGRAARAPVSGKAGLAGAALVALASVVCWAVPLMLVSIGITGAWMSTFTMLARYKSLLVGASLVCLACAWYRIYRAQGADGDESACVAPSNNRLSRALFWLVSALVLGAIFSPYLVPLIFEV